MTGRGLESQMLGIGSPILTKLWNILQKVPRAPQRDPRAPQREPSGRPKGPKGASKGSKGAPKGPKGTPKGAKWTHKSTQGETMAPAKVYIFPNSRSTAIGRPLLVINQNYTNLILTPFGDWGGPNDGQNIVHTQRRVCPPGLPILKFVLV